MGKGNPAPRARREMSKGQSDLRQQRSALARASDKKVHDLMKSLILGSVANDKAHVRGNIEEMHSRDTIRYDMHKVNAGLAQMALNSTLQLRGAVQMSDAAAEVSAVLEEAETMLDRVIGRFQKKEDTVVQEARKSAGRISDATARVKDAVLRLDGALPLERLERTAAALASLSESMAKMVALQESGALDRVAAALGKAR